MKLTMKLSTQSYDIIIKRGALSRLGGVANLKRKVLVVTDENVPVQYVNTVLSQCQNGFCITLPSGEGTKSFHYLEKLCQEMLKHNFSRKDAVVALGGGVVGDLTGFAAASYMRGISFINVPTTTLSQIDSSIGGKTAINLGDTKNIVGAFYQPELVVIDPDTLNTLSRRHFVNGLAEAVKAGFIADEGLLNIFENQNAEEAIEEIIYRSLLVKQKIVQQDEKEMGLRAVLNFGHTIGHGIESANGLGGLLHGECVALGMLPLLKTKQLKKQAVEIYKKIGLPYKTKYNGDEIFGYLSHDKKASDAEITIVTVEKAGQAVLTKIKLEDLRPVIGEGIK